MTAVFGEFPAIPLSWLTKATPPRERSLPRAMAEEIRESLPVSVATTNETDVDGSTQLGESETLAEDTQPTKHGKQ